jgi:hypothetical protein
MMSRFNTLESSAQWRLTILATTNAAGLAAATCRPSRDSDLVKQAETVRDCAGGKDYFEPVTQDANVQNRLRQVSSGLPVEGKLRLDKLAPLNGENLLDLLKKDDPVADAQWALEQWGDGGFADVAERYVAVYQKDRVGTGNDPVELTARCAKACGVVPSRIIIKYVGRED